jgi:hypothetical protein
MQTSNFSPPGRICRASLTAVEHAVEFEVRLRSCCAALAQLVEHLIRNRLVGFEKVLRVPRVAVGLKTVLVMSASNPRPSSNHMPL